MVFLNKNHIIRTILGCTVAFIPLSLSSCTYHKERVNQVHYYPSSRQLPPEDVYLRQTYSQLPYTSPLKSKDNSPFLLPKLAFEAVDSTLGEAVEAFAQTIGYHWKYPQEIASRKVNIRMEANAEEILAEIAKQGSVEARLNHHDRVVVIN